MGLSITIPPWTSYSLTLPRRSRTLATCCAPVRRFAKGIADCSKMFKICRMFSMYIHNDLCISFYITWYDVIQIYKKNKWIIWIMNRMYSSAGCTGGYVRHCSLFKLHFDVFPLTCPYCWQFMGNNKLCVVSTPGDRWWHGRLPLPLPATLHWLGIGLLPMKAMQ